MGPQSTPASMPSEGLESLMSLYQQADEDAATALIRRVTPLLRRYAFLVRGYQPEIR